MPVFETGWRAGAEPSMSRVPPDETRPEPLSGWSLRRPTATSAGTGPYQLGHIPMCAPGATRTRIRLVRNQVLHPLSYGGMRGRPPIVRRVSDSNARGPVGRHRVSNPSRYHSGNSPWLFCLV